MTLDFNLLYEYNSYFNLSIQAYEYNTNFTNLFYFLIGCLSTREVYSNTADETGGDILSIGKGNS